MYEKNIINEEKVKNLRKKIYFRVSWNDKQEKPKRDKEMIDMIDRVIRDEVDKCF